MLKSISWHDLFHAILIIFCLYYLAFLIMAYKKEIRIFFTGNRLQKPSAEDTDQLPRVLKELDILARVLCKMLAKDIKALIQRVADDQADKQDLLRGISDRLQEHKQLQNTSHGQALTTFISQECARNNIRIDDGEIIACWGTSSQITPPQNNP